MPDHLPHFRYHPHPVGTGMIVSSDAECVCCGQKRGWIYTGPVYGEQELHDALCPWCISDGSAASVLGASFADAHPLHKAGVDRRVIDEVSLRTPSYNSWQQEEWLSHCGDACEFHGDAAKSDLEHISEHVKGELLLAYRLDAQEWGKLVASYVPKGGPAIYKFVCRHCGLVLLGIDCS